MQWFNLTADSYSKELNGFVFSILKSNDKVTPRQKIVKIDKQMTGLFEVKAKLS